MTEDGGRKMKGQGQRPKAQGLKAQELSDLLLSTCYLLSAIRHQLPPSRQQPATSDQQLSNFYNQHRDIFHHALAGSKFSEVVEERGGEFLGIEVIAQMDETRHSWAIS
jgi:hypothetical protein